MTIRFNWWWMLPILLLSAGLTAAFLVYDQIWFDEVMTHVIVGMGGNYEQRNIIDLLWVTALDNSWPPAYFLLAAAWNLIAQANLLMTRSLPFFIGVISVAVMYRTGKSLFSEKVGIYSSLLLGTCAFYLFYFHEVRGYSLYVLSSIMQLWAYWMILKPENYQKRSLRWFFILSTILAIYSHYVAIVSVGVIGVYHLLMERKNENWLDILRLGINSCLSYTPWIGAMAISLYNQSLGDRSVLITGALNGAFAAFSNNFTLPFLIVLFASLLFIREKRIQLLWFWLLGIVVFVALGNLYAKFIFHPRHFIVLLIPVCLLLAYVIDQLDKYLPTLSFGILLLWLSLGIIHSHDLSFIYSLPEQYPSVRLESMNAALKVTETCVQENDAVILDMWHEERNIGTNIHNVTYYYFLGEAPFRYAQLQAMVLIDDFLVRDDPENVYEEEVRNVVQDAAHIWLLGVPEHTWDEERFRFENIIAEDGYVSCGVFEENPNFIGYVYSSDASQCETLISTCNP